ncbi:MAG: TonB-dependent receptor [Ruegeria sp.]|nr:TonB-dependent receptor [Ruegeria sp.]
MKKTALLKASAAAILAASTTADAQETIDIGTIVISGGFTPIEEQKYGRAASVITAEEIARRGITTVQDALRAVPGVSVSGSGETLTQVRIRGAESSHTLILINGVPAAGGDGEYILSGIQTANIERIEVLRGPQSVFYGSNASAGVVNIITKRGGLGHEYGGTVEFGDGYNASARYSYRNDKGGVAVGIARLDDDGYDYSGSNGEKDSVDRTTIDLTGDYFVAEGLKLGFVFRDSDENYDFDSTDFLATTPEGYVVDDPTQRSERKERLGQVYAEYEARGGQMVHRFSYDRTDNEQATNGGTPTETDRNSARYLLSLGLDGRATVDSNHLLNGIVEWEEDSSSSDPEFERETTSYALEYRGSLENGLNVQAGVRYDDNKTFENDFTWTLAASYTLPQGVRLHGSAGTGIVNPSYFELFADSFGFVGNPNLKPEKNKSFDLGAEVPFWAGRGLVDVTLFHDDLTDEITSVFDPVLGSSTFINQAGDSARRGVEVSGSLEATDTLDLRLSYTYIDAENPDGSVEVRRPRHELLLTATQEFLQGRGSVTGDIRYVADNYDTQFFGSFETKKLPDYVTVDVAAQYSLTDNVKLTGRIVNLFDREYSDVWGYAKRGRTGYIGLSAAF